MPTTDRLQLNGVPFQRSGARYNAATGGIEARLTRSTDFTTRYEMTWVDFDREDTLLTGGIVNGLRTSLSRRFTERLSLGGEYDIRLANLNAGRRNQIFQDGGAVFRYRAAETTTFEAAGGLAHLNDQTLGLTRTGPYVRAELTHRARRATVGAEFRHSYVPSVAFGGTNQTQTVRGYIHMPLNHNRFYIQETATWYRTNPFDTSDPAAADGVAQHRPWLRRAALVPDRGVSRAEPAGYPPGRRQDHAERGRRAVRGL